MKTLVEFVTELATKTQVPIGRPDDYALNDRISHADIEFKDIPQETIEWMINQHE